MNKAPLLLSLITLSLIILLVPGHYLTLVYPLIGVIIAISLRSITVSLIAILFNIIILTKYLGSVSLILLNNLKINDIFLKIVFVVSTIFVLIIYIIILLVQKIRKKDEKDPFLKALISIKKSYYILLQENNKGTLLQILAASAIMLAAWAINPYIPWYTTYFYIISVPLYILVSPLFNDIVDQILAIITFAASLKYPLIILILYILRNAETITIVIQLQQRRGAKVGLAVATLIKNPIIKYSGINLNTSSPTYYWSPLARETPYKIAVSITDNPHVVITGTSGAGKSYTASIIAKRLSSLSRASIIIFDPHGEYKTIISDSLVFNPLKYSINPLELYNKSPRQRALELASMVSALYKLGPLQTKILEEAILLAYEAKGIIENEPSTWGNPAPSLHDVVHILKMLARKDQRAQIVKTYIESLNSRIFAETTINMEELLNRNKPIIIDLSSISERTWQRFYMELFLERFYQYIKEKGMASGLRAVVVIDEAHLIASKSAKRQTIVANMTAELRKYGVALILITQRLDDMDKTVLANIGTKIALRQVEPRVAKYVAETLAVSIDSEEINAIIETLGILPQGYAIVRDYNIAVPLLVAIK